MDISGYIGKKENKKALLSPPTFEAREDVRRKTSSSLSAEKRPSRFKSKSPKVVNKKIVSKTWHYLTFTVWITLSC